MIDSSRVLVYGDIRTESGNIKSAIATVLVDLIPIAKFFVDGPRKSSTLLTDSAESDYKLWELGLSIDNKDSRIFRDSAQLVSLHGIAHRKLLQQVTLLSRGQNA